MAVSCLPFCEQEVMLIGEHSSSPLSGKHLEEDMHLYILYIYIIYTYIYD